MSDDLNPDDAFTDELGDRLRSAAEPVDGTAVTRAGVASAVALRRRRQARTRATVVGVAAAVALLGGLAVVTRSSDDGTQTVDAAGSTTSTTAAPCPVEAPPSGPIGWFRLTADQATVLLDAGAITVSQAEQIAIHAVLLSHADIGVLSAHDRGETLGRQLFDLGYEDSAGIDRLRSEGMLTPDQEADVAHRIVPVLDQAQVDRLFEQYPDMQAIDAGGHPFPTEPPTFSSPQDTTITEASPSPDRCGQDPADAAGLGSTGPQTGG